MASNQPNTTSNFSANNNNMSLNNRQDNRDPKAVKQKAAEVKLHLLGVMQTMQKEGKMPHNTELNDLLEKLKTNRIISSREHLMSTDGKNLLHDFRDLLNVIQKALVVKNKDELFQSLVYHIHCMDTPISKENIRESIKSQNRGASAQQEGKKGSNALMKIVKLMLINNEFRSVLGELLDISQDIFNNMTHKMGNSIQQTGSNNNNNNRSGKERMDNVLDSAVNRLDDNQEYHRDRSGSRSSYHDREPQLINAPSDDHRHQGLLNTGDTVHPRAIPGILSDINTNVASSGGIQNPEYSHLPPNTMNHISGKSVNAPRHSTNMASGTYNNYGPQEGYSSGTGNINAPSGNKPYYSEQQDNFHHNDFNTQQRNQSHPYAQHARDTVDEHKQYARDTVNEKLPQEKQDELIRRLKNALAEVERNPDFQSAISTLIHLIKTWSNRFSHVSDNMKSEAKQNETPEQMDYKDRAQSEFKAILETWTQGFSIDPLLNGVQNVMHDMEHDDALRNYYDSIVNYVKRLVRDPEYARRDASTEDGRKLMDKGNSIIKDRYRDHLDYLTSESRHYMRLMTDDEIAQELRNCVSKIHNDLWKDNDGNPAFKPHLFNDMRMTLLPAFIDEIKYIPIPRIEYSDAQYDIAIENLILSGDSLLPNVFDTKLESFNSFSLKTDAPSKPSHQSMLIRMSEIQAKVEDVVFYYKKKTGFPRISDSGVASLNIGGKGITVTTRINSIVDDPTRTFKVTYCKCNVDNLSIKVNDSHHDILYKAIRPLVIGQIRKQISKGVEMKVIDTLNQIDQRLTSSITHMNQKLQDKAYNALPEEERVNLSAANTSSQAQTRHGFFSTVVNLINHNIKQRSTRHRSSSAGTRRRFSFSPQRRRSSRNSTQQQQQQQPEGISHECYPNDGYHQSEGLAQGGMQADNSQYNSNENTNITPQFKNRQHEGVQQPTTNFNQPDEGVAYGGDTFYQPSEEGFNRNKMQQLENNQRNNDTGIMQQPNYGQREGRSSGGMQQPDNYHEGVSSGRLGEPYLDDQTRHPTEGISHVGQTQGLNPHMEQPYHQTKNLDPSDYRQDHNINTDQSYAASMDTGRYHHIDSPPVLPTKNQPQYNDRNDFKIANDLSNAQDEYERTQRSHRV